MLAILLGGLTVSVFFKALNIMSTASRIISSFVYF